MNRPPARPAAAWPLYLAIALCSATILALGWLRWQLHLEERQVLLATARVFQTTNVLGQPEVPTVRFAAVESLARSAEGNDAIRRMVVAKRRSDGSEAVVYPFAWELVNPQWREELGGWEMLEVPGQGRIWIQLERGTRSAVDRVILFNALFLIAGIAVLIVRQMGKETELSRTISELEERKAEVIRLERLALAGQLSANIFHDIKKPVLNIKHEIEGLDTESDHGIRDSLRAVAGQTDLFLSMIRELGFEKFVRPGDDAAEFCAPSDMIARSLALVKYERGDVEVVVEDLAPGDALVFAPPYRLVQVFSNLVLNAYQAMDGRGCLRITITGTESEVRLAIADSGPGISPEVSSRLFQPFATTRSDAGGSGLGLYICRQIVEELGGTIHADSPGGGVGARLTVMLPANTEGANA